MTYILRFSGKDAIGCWPASSNELDGAINEARDLTKLMEGNAFIDELQEGNLKEIYVCKYTPQLK